MVMKGQCRGAWLTLLGPRGSLTCLLRGGKSSWVQLALSKTSPEWKRTFRKLSALARFVTFVFRLL